MYIVALKALLAKIKIYPLRKVQITTLKQNEASIKVSTKYTNFANIFSEKKILVLPKQIKFNQYAIELKRDKQLFYRLIYSLWLIEPKILKIFIKIHLKTGFI